MFDLATLLVYCGVVGLLFLVPGPAVLLTLARSVSGGAKVGVATGAGIAVGDALHTLAAIIGLSAILMTSALAYEIVRYLGAGYLIYLGVVAIRDRARNVDVPEVASTGAVRAFRQAILIEILNPKTALFFLAFLPQFTDPAQGALWLQLLVLGAIFVGMSVAYTSIIAFSAGAASTWLRTNRTIAKWQGKLVGSVYIALGLQLAFQDRR
ncbi:MAG: LysE family translocator [Geminicoccaceae bacterium]